MSQGSSPQLEHIAADANEDALVLRAIAQVIDPWLHRALKECGGLKLHPDKTTIGSIKKGFDFLGYAFDSFQLTTNINTIEKSKTKLLALYEQAKRKLHNGKRLTKHVSIADRLAQYWQNFCRWLRAGLPSLIVNINWQETLASCREQLPIGIIERLVSIPEKSFR